MHQDFTSKSLDMQKLAQSLIPGKTQLLSKRPEMFAPNIWPGYYKKAKGSQVWDLDGKEYFDFSIGGIGANVLGYADNDVDESVIQSIKLGSSSSLNCEEEVELASYLNSKFSWLEMFRFTRSGGEAMAVAVRIARTKSSRSLILFCGYHGWHDWYLAANLSNLNNLDQHLLSGLSANGVPQELVGTAIPFVYNDIESLKKLMKIHKNKIAAVVMEPKLNINPINDFLADVRELCTAEGIILIFDEITSAFRESAGPIHELFSVYPDIAVFSKAISNGYPMGIVCGSSETMQAAQDTFISSTSWTERIGPVASLATIKKFVSHNVHLKLCEIGDLVHKGWESAAKLASLEVEVKGLRPILNFNFVHEDNLVLRTLFVQKMLTRGFLASNRFYAMYTHTPEMTSIYIDSVHEVFLEIKNLIARNAQKSALIGPVAHSNFKKLN